MIKSTTPTGSKTTSGWSLTDTGWLSQESARARPRDTSLQKTFQLPLWNVVPSLTNWSNTCHQVCRSNLKTYVTQCVKIWKKMPILSSEVLPINRCHFSFSLFTASFSLASFSLKTLFNFFIVIIIFFRTTLHISFPLTTNLHKNGRFSWIQPSYPENLFFQET